MLLRKKKVIATIIIASIVTSTSLPIFAAENDDWTEADKTNSSWQQWCEEWEMIKNDWTQISLTPGKDISELNFAWYSVDGESSPKVRIGKASDMSDAKEFIGTQSNAVPGYKSNKVTVTRLESNSTYYYSYGTDGNWSNPVVYKTQSTDKFEFILIGDPQIGSSSKNVASNELEAQGQDKATRNDTFNWNNTLKKALEKSPNASFILSVGDQIQSRDKKATGDEALNYTGNEIEYAGFLSPSILKSLPIATSLGNHDAISGNYSYHFNNPNASSLGSTAGGGDYSFRYGDALFIMLNTNNTNVAEHKKFLENEINNNQDAKWRIVTLHQDIYGSAEHSNEPSIAKLRYELVPIFEDNDIDVVLTGHDHAYSRSEILKGGKLNTETIISDDEFEYYLEKEVETGQEVTDEKYVKYLQSIEDKNAVVTDLDIQSDKVVNPDGILYMTSNSASGSKYYQNVLRKQAYIAKRWQENVPTFSTVSIDDVSFSINTYRTDTMEKIDQTYTIVKSMDKSNLVELISEAEGMVKDVYTTSTWKVFEGTLANAKAVAVQGDATEDIIANAFSDLKEAMNALVEKANTSKLSKVIEEAELLLKEADVGNRIGQYSQKAVDDLKDVVEDAKSVLNNEEVPQSKVDETITAVNYAIDVFKKQVIVSTESNNGSNVGAENSVNNSVINKAENPKTGENSILLSVVAFISSALGIGSLAYFNRKRKEE